MLLSWRIRYLDTRDKQFRDRDLYLDTSQLDPVIKAAVETCYETGNGGSRRAMLRHRHLFHGRDPETDLNELCCHCGGMSVFCLPDYFEDENGEELTNKRMGAVLTGRSDAVAFPAGTPQYMIDYVFAEKPPIAVDQISLSEDDLRTLAYFTRDVREMQASAFFQEKPGTLTSVARSDPVLQTASTDEEIRSFVTVFRRLYMEKEPGSFLKAAAVFEKALGEHPLGRWIKGAADEHKAELGKTPHFVSIAGQTSFSHSRKRLIDVFIYTRYAHQPDERRTRQYEECLSAVDGKRAVLTWLFLAELHMCGLRIWNAGRIIADFVDSYCRRHKVSLEVLAPISIDNPRIGALEKEQARRDRIFNDRAEQLAKAIWEQKGCPAGGDMQFLDQAREQLSKALGASS